MACLESSRKCRFNAAPPRSMNSNERSLFTFRSMNSCRNAKNPKNCGQLPTVQSVHICVHICVHIQMCTNQKLYTSGCVHIMILYTSRCVQIVVHICVHIQMCTNQNLYTSGCVHIMILYTSRCVQFHELPILYTSVYTFKCVHCLQIVFTFKCVHCHKVHQNPTQCEFHQNRIEQCFQKPITTIKVCENQEEQRSLTQRRGRQNKTYCSR